MYSQSEDSTVSILHSFQDSQIQMRQAMTGMTADSMAGIHTIHITMMTIITTGVISTGMITTITQTGGWNNPGKMLSCRCLFTGCRVWKAYVKDIINLG